jgi:hypothetical protein
VWNAAEVSETWRKRALADELGANRQAYAEAWGNIGLEPGMFCYSCLVRIGRLWGSLPHQVDPCEGSLRRAARYAVGLWYLAELPLAAFGAWRAVGRGGAQQWLWGLLLAGCLTAVHSLYWSDLRMRAPLMPVVALAAAVGLVWGGKAPAAAATRPSQPGC